MTALPPQPPNHGAPAEMKGRRFLLREISIIAAACLLAFTVAVAATLLASVLICAGFHPESLAAVDSLAVYLGLFFGAAWAVSRSGGLGWRRTLIINTLAIAVWILVWLYVTSRTMVGLWWPQGVGTLTTVHLSAWMQALVIGMFAAFLGARMRSVPRRYWAIASGLGVCVIPIGMYLSRRGTQAETPLAAFATAAGTPLAKGVSIRCAPPDGEGTTVRLITFDYAVNPDLEVRLYDSDSDDAVPYDNANTAFLGQSIDFVLGRLRARTAGERREIVALFNAGFFGGSARWIAQHERPIVIDGKPHYNLDAMDARWRHQAWLFGVVRQRNRTRFELLPAPPFAQLARYDTAIDGIRPLLVNGKPQSLEPGTGAPGLRCSRTSAAWSTDSRFFHVLIVRDPDGEMGSIRQRRSKVPQTGGWDAARIVEFWRGMKVSNAVLFDGGESTQSCHPSGGGQFTTVRSSYNLSLTLGYWRSRPIRLFIPMLPSPLAQGGVLNYLYITSPHDSGSARAAK